MENLSECARQNIIAINRFLGQRTGVSTSVAVPIVRADQGVFLLNTAGAGVATISLPQAGIWPGREITIVNYSGAAQNVVSYNGTALEIKTQTGAAVATHSIENSVSLTSGRRTFKSISGLWTLISI